MNNQTDESAIIEKNIISRTKVPLSTEYARGQFLEDTAISNTAITTDHKNNIIQLYKQQGISPQKISTMVKLHLVEVQKIIDEYEAEQKKTASASLMKRVLSNLKLSPNKAVNKNPVIVGADVVAGLSEKLGIILNR